MSDFAPPSFPPLRIGGMGWVTPLGSGVTSVWEKLLAGEEATPESIESPLNSSRYPVFRVPPQALAGAPAHPRLRRSSAISRFAVVAGLAALEDAQIKLDAETAARTAIIFAISNGGVVYTKRFYHEIVETGAQAASPLLFPETVFNAPASHLAALLGITGASYTLVGDGTVGLLALKMAEDLMQNPAIDRCLVVGSEEADWLLCDAFHRWRLLRSAPPVEVFRAKPRGLVLSEGAGAILLDRTGSTLIEAIDPDQTSIIRRKPERVWAKSSRSFNLKLQPILSSPAPTEPSSIPPRPPPSCATVRKRKFTPRKRRSVKAWAREIYGRSSARPRHCAPPQFPPTPRLEEGSKLRITANPRTS